MFYLLPESMQRVAIRTSISRVSIVLVCGLRTAHRQPIYVDKLTSHRLLPRFRDDQVLRIWSPTHLYLREMTLEKRLNDEMFIFDRRLLRPQLVQATGRQ
jgi:hypothetical protein